MYTSIVQEFGMDINEAVLKVLRPLLRIVRMRVTSPLIYQTYRKIHQNFLRRMKRLEAPLVSVQGIGSFGRRFMHRRFVIHIPLLSGVEMIPGSRTDNIGIYERSRISEYS